MGVHVIKMPDIGEGIAEVELVAWHVQPGDAVAEDQLLADVMTDKATVEIPSPVAGKVLALGGAVGQTMAVGGELIRIEVEGAGNLREGAVAAAPQAAAPAPAVTAAAAMPPAPATAAPATRAAAPSHAAAPVAAKELRSAPAAAPTSAPIARRPGEKPIASPSVRRRAWDLGIELRFVPGSGPGGRILHADLDAYAERAAAAAPSGARGASYQQRNDEQAVPVIGLRRRIALKMQEAKRRIPHFTYVEEVDVTELEALRQQLNKRWGDERGRLTLLPLLARALVQAVREFPQVNARFDDEAGVVTRFGAVHIGIATQTASGLMVPVLRHAESLDLWAASAEIARVAEAARGGHATRDELTGSTITITSLGALGGIVSTPVINHPEVAIIGVNRMVERPTMRAGSIVPRLLMNLSSSFDHRVVDGMDAAQFIQSIRGMLECPATLFVE
ncbi:MAG: dihydrolipoamide acyltransferase [Burkholderiaceae bacterium]|jgi:2-oxoisovalerate dehydrogenase E2 component (dihydrolipoyl transacylase)|nr:MAG: dihydrolipoamide acyltransferase [Burkholderiaceae bacterium]